MKLIDNFEHYFVNESGDVFSTKRGKLIKLSPFKCGKDRKYLKVRLYRDGVSCDEAVHRLVAKAYVDNPDGLNTVNHKDENTFNNSASNLEWISNGDNKRYSSGRELTLISPSGVEVTEPSISMFSTKYGLSNGSLYHLLKGKYSHHKGWRLPISF